MNSNLVDKDRCIACGLCSQTCPEVFELVHKEGFARRREDAANCSQADCCREAAELCPVDAIKREDSKST